MKKLYVFCVVCIVAAIWFLAPWGNEQKCAELGGEWKVVGYRVLFAGPLEQMQLVHDCVIEK